MAIRTWTGIEVFALREDALRDTQEEFAERTGFSVAVISKWERRGATITLKGRFAEGMDTLYARLTPEQRQRFTAAVDSVLPSELYPERVHTRSPEDAATKRREFLAFTGLSMVDIPRHVGIADVTTRRDAFARLQDLDHHLGGGDTFRLYSTELAHTEAILKNSAYSQNVYRALTELVAEQAQQTGWAAYDAGHTPVAVGLYKYSHWAAKEAGNHELAANALIHISYATETPESVADAVAACRYLRSDTTPKVVAMLESRRAWAHAIGGDGDRAERALGRAETALARGGSGPNWCEWMDETELAIMAGRVWTVLRRPDKAIDPFEMAIAAYPDHWSRDRALYMTWLAEAHLDARNADRADELAGTALALAETTASVRPAKRVAELTGRLAEARTPEGASLRMRAEKIKPPVPVSL